MNKLDVIREEEALSHEAIYTSKRLYESGSWLSKPVQSIIDLVPYFSNYSQINILDLGSGIGRNSIPWALEYPDKASIDCVDILRVAIEQLLYYAQTYGVKNCFNGFVTPLEDFEIKREYYDLIMAVSALEHVSSEESFFAILSKIS